MKLGGKFVNSIEIKSNFQYYLNLNLILLNRMKLCQIL